jgi:hypothetical protein
MWFDSRKPPPQQELTPEEIAAQQREQQRQALLRKLDQALTSDPAFKVMTVDGLNWICPFTGTRIPSPFGYQDPAREHLLKTQPWTQAKAKKLDELQQFRWLLHLKEHLEFEPRMRMFHADGRWLNPYNGQWVRVGARDNRITPEVLQDLALVLSKCPEAQSGQLMEVFKLEEVARASRLNNATGQLPGASAGTNVTTRVSGSRAGATAKDTTTQSIKGGLDDDLERAKSIIEKMLTTPPTIPGFNFVVHYEPQQQVGGDWYECLEIEPGRFFICLGDVTGHGVQGAMVVVAALKALRHILKHEKSLVDILARLNDDIKTDLLTGQFITMFAGILDVRETTFTCVLAGHHKSLLASSERAVVLEQVGNKGAALGLLSSEMFKRTLRPLALKLEPGDTLIAYTDGLTEAHNASGVEYGEMRFMGSIIGHLDQPYDEVVSAMVQSARNFAAGVMEDDVTVISLSIEPPKDE